jgi:quercetin dioxygenase-like cupin family protein
VLEGGVTFEVAVATADDYAFGPRNVPHSYRAAPDGGRMLLIVTPAGYGGGSAGALLLGGEYVPPIEQSRARSQPRRG